MSIQRNPLTGKIVPKRFTMSEIEQADSDYAGYCLACGAYRESCEPDARKYECVECGLHLVYGAAEIALMGLVKEEMVDASR